MTNDIVYKFQKNIYFSFKDISFGIMLFNNKELIYGLKGRVIGLEINLIFVHIKAAFIKSGHGLKKEV